MGKIQITNRVALPAVSLLVLLGAACATYPENVSYLYGERFHRANFHTFATVITAVDGQTTMPHAEPIRIESGRHVIQLATAPTAGFRVAGTRELVLNVIPCRRYYIVAERGNRLQQDWHPIIDHIEVAGGDSCR